MKRPLHPGAIAAALAVFVAALGALLVRFDARGVARSDAASPYTRIGERPTSAGSGTNSLTGEPLAETAKAYEAASFAEHAASPGALHDGR